MELQAHALGAVRGRIYTNSLAAFESSYRKGFRRFEVDVNPTSDGYFVCSHDTERLRNQTYEEFMADPCVGIHGQGSGFFINEGGTLDLKRISELISKYEDVSVMIDFQPGILNSEDLRMFDRFIAAIQENVFDLSRIVVEVVSEEQVKRLSQHSIRAIAWLSPKTECEVLPLLKLGHVTQASVSRDLLSAQYVEMLHSHGVIIFSPGWDSYHDYKRAIDLKIDVITTHYTWFYRFCFYYLRVVLYGILTVATFNSARFRYGKALRRVLAE